MKKLAAVLMIVALLGTGANLASATPNTDRVHPTIHHLEDGIPGHITIIPVRMGRFGYLFIEVDEGQSLPRTVKLTMERNNAE